MNNKIYKFLNGNILPEITVVPTRLVLDTYYPVIGRNYRYTGHSSLRARSPEYTVDTSDGFTTVPAKHASINKRPSDSGYNFVTSNCADATRCALEAITEKKMNPYFFTTPGDVLDFFKENFDVRKVKSKNIGKNSYYTNITPAQLEMIKELQQEQVQKNRKDRLKLLANARKWKHKKGGKAFVNGVSVLDSNPNAYKLVKKKVKKAEEGTKFGNWLNNNGTNLLNIGFGIKGMFDASSNLLSNLENAKKQKNLSTLSKLALKMIGADDLVNNIMLHKSLNNPDVHYGIIDYQLEKEKLRKKAYALAANEANEEYTSNILKSNQEYLNLYNSSMNNILNGLQGILFTLGSKVASNALNKNGTPSNTAGTSLLTGLKNYGTIDNNMNFSTGLGTSFNLLTGASTNYSNKYNNMLLK